LVRVIARHDRDLASPDRRAPTRAPLDVAARFPAIVGTLHRVVHSR
jgi:hypothetical protein